MKRFAFLVVSLAASWPWTAAVAAEGESDAKLEFFEKRIRPLFVNHCHQCHSAETKPAGGLRVDDRNGLLVGGDEGPAVVPGDPGQSLLLQRVQHQDAKRKMPKEGDLLTDAQVADLSAWIQDGAVWPRERVPAYIGRTRPEYEELKATHWAWQPLAKPEVPGVRDQDWPRANLDRFVLAKLEEKALPPVTEASPEILLRRITFDLTGLPPGPAEVEAFRADHSAEAYARVVDRLLASPRFGEFWGRHWLDVARYGESTGPSRNIPYPHAWKYRDYVIDAVNRDVPFDRFVREQIAGDLLPAETPAERDRLLTATGFLALGVKDVNQRFKTRFIMDNVDEQIDTVSRSILGLTVSCARCHDHKFDPVPVTDYYALAGIFTSTENCAGVRNKMGGSGLAYYDPAHLVKLSTEVPPAPEAEVEKLKSQTEEAQKAFEAVRGSPEGLAKDANGRPVQRGLRLKWEVLQKDLLALTDPAQRGEVVHGVREGRAIADTEVRIRGEAERLGPTVPRGFLTLLQLPDAPKINPASSGRLALAEWLTSSQNPLAARVIVNRVWAHLFGQGLVNTVDNFGVKGDRPSHPELLDHLAGEFVRGGWSVKRLIREIVLARTYQLGSEAPTTHREADPANRLLWRHSPRRLQAEEFRDALLAAAGRLELAPPGPSPAKALRMIEMRDNGPEARTLHEQADTALARSVYLPALRGVVPKALEVFDPVTQSLVTGQRDATTVPSQALFLLNSAFVREQSLAFARSVVAQPERFDVEAVGDLYVRILGRRPSNAETVRAETFLANFAVAWRSRTQSAMAQAAQPLSADPAETEARPADNPDDVDRTDKTAAEKVVEPASAKEAAWMEFIQALFASAEFRFVR